ncbi:hypothetical protein BDP27DRAFT_533464 [Rhodocollybia butyracea]|uniref:Nephrocystin 3-like N-terminal domain-containing protein n=1 Tax=Rhodocollybia butyracea TaxID=206335 RepID=A0A9P5PWC7_9AGAR|nr:hypothetical protein BDP27DRAFT_533464 [Rhodocollybia butyracea]
MNFPTAMHKLCMLHPVSTSFLHCQSEACLCFPAPLPSSMSIFENSHHFEVIGGKFYAVTGDVNIEKASSSSSSNVQTSGVQRSNRRGARYTPYTNSASTEPPARSTSPVASHVLEAEKSSNSGPLMTSDTSKVVTRQFLSLPPSPRIDIDTSPIQRTEYTERSDGYLPPNYSQPTTTINDCTFVSNTRQGEKGIDRLHNMAALEALHDSADSYPQPQCHPETRTKMLEDLQEWSRETDPAHRIMWLFGPAGAGKSAIMRTLSNQLQSDGRLGGCFFFKRGHPTRGNAKVLFVTIAYQLALDVPWLRDPISQVVEHNPSVLARSFDIQLQKLIFEPCHMHPNQIPLTILIDGLDECEDQGVHLNTLRTIRKCFTDHPLPLRFIIASRPEPHIREMFESPVYHGVYQPFKIEQSFHDVQTYFLDEFARIHHEHRQTMSTISLPWPLPQVMDKLVSKSSGYFIYASTVIKFIDDQYYRPTERLAIVMQDQIGSDSPFDMLDQLYINILSTVPNAKRPKLMQMLCALVNFDKLTPDRLDKLLGLEIGDTCLFLRSLHSIFHVPGKEQDIYSHHASFYDFLRDPNRSQDFYACAVHHCMDLAGSMLRFFACLYDQNGFWGSFQYILNKLLHFIPSLPPSEELLPLIQNAITPACISESYLVEELLEMMLAWIKKIHPVPGYHIQLWEAYGYMKFMLFKDFSTSRGSIDKSIEMSSSFAHAISSQSGGLLHFLHSIVLMRTDEFNAIRSLLDVSWSDLLSNISWLHSTIGKDEELWNSLCSYIVGLSFNGEIFPWPSLSRDLARQCIRIGKNTCAGKLEDYRSVQALQIIHHTPTIFLTTL